MDFLKLYEGFNAVKTEYFLRGNPNLCGDAYFLMTEKFKSLCKGLDEGKRIQIRGPKGVGKSVTLAAIATLYHKKRPCLFWYPDTCKSVDFQSYFEDFSRSLVSRFSTYVLCISYKYRVANLLGY